MLNIPFYTKSIEKDCFFDFINAGTSSENIKTINISGKNYQDPSFFPRPIGDWPDTFEIKLKGNDLVIRRTDVKIGGWGSPLLIDVEDKKPESLRTLLPKKIPRVIYQTFKSRDVPKGMYDAVNSWIKMNPEYEHFFYDDESCAEFIKNNFSNDVLQAYHMLIPGAYKADLWRCCVLYVKGGVYVDSDMECLKPLDSYIDPDDEFVVPRDDPMSKSFLYNAFMACYPKHKFMLKQIKNIVKNVFEQKKIYHLDISGPGLLGKTVNKCLNRDINHEYSLGSYKVNEYKMKVFFHEWQTKTIKDKNTELIFTEYTNKNKEMEEIKIPTYYSLYEKGILYQKIPMKIHFTTEDCIGLNEYMIESFKEKNPYWSLEYSNGDDRAKYLMKNKEIFQELLNVDVYKKYSSIKNKGAQADFWRYCKIYLEGGVYVDSDTACNVPLKKWILNHDLILGIEACLPFEEAKNYGLNTVGKLIDDNYIVSLCNWAFAAEPKHIFFKKLIIKLCNRDLNENNAAVDTGPKPFTEQAFDYFKDCDFSLLKQKKDLKKDESIIFSINRFGSHQSHSASNFVKNDDVYIIHFFDGAWRFKPNKKIKIFNSKLGCSHNLSICKKNDNIFGISRLDVDTSRTIFMKKIGDCRSFLNYDFDENFNLIKESKVNIKNYNTVAKFEDYRIFSFNNEMYFSVSYISEDFNTRMAILNKNGEFLGDVNIKKELGTFFGKIWEKNWLFFEKDNDLYFIYSTYPRYIVYKCINFSSLHFEKFIDMDWPQKGPNKHLYGIKDIGVGGSTNPIPIFLENKKLFLYMVHTKIYHKAKYNHYLVLLNEDLSPCNFFLNPLIDENISYNLFFISSMIINNDYLILSGGVQDRHNFVWELSKDYIFKKFLRNF